MNHPITKEDAAWLAIRCTGFLFAWMAYKNIASFLWAVHMLTSEELSEIRESLSLTVSWEVAWPKAVMFILYGCVAYYLIRHGRWLHNCITYCKTDPKHTNEQLSTEEEP